MSVEPYWPDWGACSNPPAESCSDAGCPVHGDEAGLGIDDWPPIRLDGSHETLTEDGDG